MIISIRHRYSDKILFQGEYKSISHAVAEAIKTRADLRDADLRGVDLNGADLRSADLRSAYLCGADLRSADLRDADLRDANLCDANLWGANLCDANLCGANLYGANLYGANLRGADLWGANLCDANLCGADMGGADLRGADMGGEKLILAPTQIYNLGWNISITPEYLKIGCQRHTHEAWKAFTRADIARMTDKDWDWWKEHKDLILAACELHAKTAKLIIKE